MLFSARNGFHSRSTVRLALLGAGLVMFAACDSSDTADTSTGDDQDTSTDTGLLDTPVDIYNAIFTDRSVDCGDYVNTYDATVVDIKNSLTFNADILVEATETECVFTSNTVPNHDFNDETAAFAGGHRALPSPRPIRFR